MAGDSKKRRKLEINCRTTTTLASRRIRNVKVGDVKLRASRVYKYFCVVSELCENVLPAFPTRTNKISRQGRPTNPTVERQINPRQVISPSGLGENPRNPIPSRFIMSSRTSLFLCRRRDLFSYLSQGRGFRNTDGATRTRTKENRRSAVAARRRHFYLRLYIYRSESE